MTLFRPNYRRAREIKSALDQLHLDLDEAQQDDAPGAALNVHDIKQAMRELEHMFFLTGVSSECDL